MAIQKDLDSSAFGVGFGGAYFRLHNVHVMWTPTVHRVAMSISVFAVKPQTTNQLEVASCQFEADMAAVEAMPGDTFLSKCYAFVMAQEDMAGAQAV